MIKVCLNQAVSRNKPSLAILGELHVPKLLCFIHFGLLLSAKNKMMDPNQNHSKGQAELLGCNEASGDFVTPDWSGFDFLKCFWSCFGNFNHENIFHFLNIITNFELKNKIHWCKDSKAISDLHVFSLGHRDIQNMLAVFCECSAPAEIIPLSEVTRVVSKFIRNVKN